MLAFSYQFKAKYYLAEGLYRYILLTLTIATQLCFAQNFVPNCGSEILSSVNFLIGDWVVYDNGGKKVGRNIILKMRNDCILQDKWQLNADRGINFIFYNEQDDKWYKVRVSKNGSTSEFVGNKIANGIEFTSTKQESGQFNGDQQKITYLLNGEIVEEHISLVGEDGYETEVISSLYYHRM